MNDIDLVRSRNPLGDVAGEFTELKGKGILVGLCPLHEEDTASFHVYPGDGGFYCYGCGVGGDVFSFVQRLQGVDFPGALKYLADRAGIKLNGGPPDPEVVKLRERREREVAEAAERLEDEHLHYLRSRGLTAETMQRLRIGVTADGRYLLPVLRHGRPTYLIRHDPEGEPRYRYPKGEPRPLLGAEKLARDETVYVVEGFFDWAVLDQVGLPAVALLGSNGDVEELSQADDLVLLLDGDDAGRTAAESLAWDLYPLARSARLPEGEDPNDLAVEHEDGFEFLVRRLERDAVDALDLQLDQFEESENLADLTEAYELVARLPVDSTEEDVAVGRIHDVAKGHGVRKATIRQDVERARKDALAESLRKEAARAREEAPDPVDLLDAGREILEADDQLALFRKEVRRSGYVGDTEAVELVHVALSSRGGERPINGALIGPSAGGKTHTVDTATSFHPPDTVHDLDGMSERALAYSDFPTEHRYVVISEASALHNDGVGATLIRGLAWGEGIQYETVEKVDGKLQARTIQKPGPTGLLTTSTKPLDPEISTRLIEIHITDSPRQTRAIVDELARQASGGRDTDVDRSAWHAASEWLASEGDTEVVVPFAHAIGDRVPTETVRMRRDFQQIMQVVRTLAFMHQRSRERDEFGRIVATRADYVNAHRLLKEVLAVTIDSVSEETRQTVEAVERLNRTAHERDRGVSYPKLADELGLSRSGAWRRARNALRSGYLANAEERKGYPAKLVTADPLPEARAVLPDPEEIPSESYTLETTHTLNTPGERGSTTGKTTVEDPVERPNPLSQ